MHYLHDEDKKIGILNSMGKIILINLVTCFVVSLIVQNNRVEMIFWILQLLLIIEKRNAILDLQLKHPRQIG